jgi:hypothetical protein
MTEAIQSGELQKNSAKISTAFSSTCTIFYYTGICSVQQKSIVIKKYGLFVHIFSALLFIFNALLFLCNKVLLKNAVVILIEKYPEATAKLQ